MCGIAGIIKISRESLDLNAAATTMSKTMRHRGPDGEGFLLGYKHEHVETAFGKETPQVVLSASFRHTPHQFIDTATQPDFVLIHRRLAIVDLSPGGHQPLCTHDGKFWIVFNGEIYNHDALRESLQQLGHTFQTQTDTEVVLEAYRAWGEACLHRLNGMWAFVIWDSERRCFFGARDRFGVKPFYYQHNETVFAFASEQKVLRACPFVKTALNRDAVADYFFAGEIEYQEESFFKDILELFPGRAFTFVPEKNKLETYRWYVPAFNPRFEYPDENSFQKQAEVLREKLLEAVRLRLHADVPVGSCLSGGLDSSAIAGMIHALQSLDKKVNVGDRLKLFTAVFDDPAIDERKWAKEVVQRTGADWHTVNPQPQELLKDLEDLIQCQDVPIWSTSTYAQFRVMKLVHEQGIKVVLDGQGGDELLAGYNPYYIPFWRELKQHDRAAWKQEQMAFGAGAASYARREFLKQRIVPQLPAGLQQRIAAYYFDDMRYLAPELRAHYLTRLKNKHVILPESLNEALHLEFVNTRLKGYLKCEDRCSMHFSVESRTPFADDHELIEYVFNLPGGFKIRNGYLKALLREAMTPYLPQEIKNRRDKMGYATPNNQWITNLREEFRPYFEQDFSGILNKELILKEYDRLFSIEGQPENGRVFKFIAFAVWMRGVGF